MDTIEGIDATELRGVPIAPSKGMPNDREWNALVVSAVKGKGPEDVWEVLCFPPNIDRTYQELVRLKEASMQKLTALNGELRATQSSHYARNAVSEKVAQVTKQKNAVLWFLHQVDNWMRYVREQRKLTKKETNVAAHDREEIEYKRRLRKRIRELEGALVGAITALSVLGAQESVTGNLQAVLDARVEMEK